MPSPSPNYVLVSVLVCLLVLGYQLQRANESLVATMVRSGELYPTVYDQCELDLQEFCKSPSVATRLASMGIKDSSKVLRESNLVVGDFPLTEIPVDEKQGEEEIRPPEPEAISTVPQNRQLRTDSLHHRRLTEETTTCSLIFPFECLEKAWMEKQVNPVCSAALHQLRSVQEIQQQQNWNFRTLLWVFRATWVVFVLCTGIFRFLERLPGLLVTHRLVVLGYLVKNHIAIFWVMLILAMTTGNNAFCIVGWAWLMAGYSFQANCTREGADSKEDDCCSKDNDQHDACVCCCCKATADSNDPSAPAENGCECCNGTGRCSAACTSCCGDETGSETNAVTEEATEEEQLLPVPVVREKAL